MAQRSSVMAVVTPPLALTPAATSGDSSAKASRELCSHSSRGSSRAGNVTPYRV